ncbi:triphosphoribosyl-dephospho-CoA synthase [Methylothermus subterraneus]
MIPQEVLQQAYLQACALDVESLKPGNVSVDAPGHGMCAEDFYRSAEVSAPWVCEPKLSLGERIYLAVEATYKAVGCNTNLGIVLLAAPLLKAVQEFKGGSVRAQLRQVLIHATQEDAAWVYRAIRLANPGGLGRVGSQDVRQPPSVTLLEAMRLATDYDRIAFNYAFFYRDIYELTIPRYHDATLRWEDERLATVAVFLGLLHHIPDTHVVRKFGQRYTGMIQARVAELAQCLVQAKDYGEVLPQLRAVDAEFKQLGINPGTTADLTVATLLTARLEKLVGSPG